MLYALHEWGHAAALPLQGLAKLNIALFSQPPGAWIPGHREMVAGSELWLRLLRRYGKPEFEIRTVERADGISAVRETEIAAKPFCRLIRFEAEAARPLPRLLLVAPLSGHHATLLRDTAATFLRDHDVYVTDWRDARDVPLAEGPFGLDDYIEYVREFLTLLGPDCHVVAVCQPAVPVLAAVALMSEDGDPCVPASMTLMGGPIDTRRGHTSVNSFAQTHSLEWFERHVIQRVPWPNAGFMRRVYPGFLQHASFIAMNAGRHWKAYQDYYEHMRLGDETSAAAHRRFYDEYNAVLDLPAEFYLDTLRVVFQEHCLPLGRMRVRDRLVRPEAITRTALLTIEGERDDITGAGQTEAAQDLCPGLDGGRKRHIMAAGVGHYGIFNGRRFREEIYPAIRGFIKNSNEL